MNNYVTHGLPLAIAKIIKHNASTVGCVWLDIIKLWKMNAKRSIVTGFVKTCIVHTSIF